MVKMIVALLFLIFIPGMTSAETLADKTYILGRPIPLQVHDGFFTFPNSYTDNKKGYHFVTYLGTPRVCYIENRTEFKHLDRVRIVIEDDGRRIIWNCYRYDPKYFEVDF